MKVYMVHRESGAYSDWTYEVLGIFSSRAKAREFLKGFRFDVGRYKSDDFWDEDADYMHYDVHDVASLFTTDGGTFEFKVAGSDIPIDRCVTNSWTRGTYHITEYELNGALDGDA